MFLTLTKGILSSTIVMILRIMMLIKIMMCLAVITMIMVLIKITLCLLLTRAPPQKGSDSIAQPSLERSPTYQGLTMMLLMMVMIYI